MPHEPLVLEVVGESTEMLDHTTTARALAEGAASHLSQTVAKFVRHQHAW